MRGFPATPNAEDLLGSSLAWILILWWPFSSNVSLIIESILLGATLLHMLYTRQYAKYVYIQCLLIVENLKNRRRKQESNNITTQKQPLLTFWHSSVKMFFSLLGMRPHNMYNFISCWKQNPKLFDFKKYVFILENLDTTERIKKKIYDGT